MVIKIDHKGSEAFYQEVVNILAQYRGLLKKPERKVDNLFRTYMLLAIACAVMLAVQIILAVMWGAGTSTKMLMIVMTMLFAVLLIYLFSLNKLKKAMMKDARSSLVTIDETGVELNKEDSQVVKLAWSNVAFVRVFPESVCFFSKDASGILIAMERAWEGEVVPYLRTIVPDLKIIQ